MILMITKKLLHFLKQIEQNNNKSWFDEHREEYHIHKRNFRDFFDEFTGNAVMVDNNLTDSIWEWHIFRINRDIRFSKNKNPYKPFMGGFICPGWKHNKNIRARYYLHIEPWNSFIGWGAHMPEKAYLDAIRNRIWEKWDELVDIISNPNFKKYYKILREWEALKTAPKWFPKDHKYIEFLRKKHITAISHLSDEQVLSEDIHDLLSERIKALKPLNDWLNSIYI